MTSATQAQAETGKQDAPFVHMFRTEAFKYAYDVNSSRIMRVDDVNWELLSDWGASDAEIAARLGGQARLPEVLTARRRIQELSASEELFSTRRTRQVRSPFSRQEVEKELSGHCRHLILCVSEQCNLRCKYCYYGGGRATERQHSQRLMTWETARKAVQFFEPRCRTTFEEWRRESSNPTKVITSELVTRPCVGFYGGEPLMNWPLVKRVVEYVRGLKDGQDYYINGTFNGTLLTPEICRFFADNSVAMLISFDGPKELHDRYRRFAGGGETWDRIVANLRYMRDNMPEYYNKSVALTAVVAPPMDLRVLMDFIEKWDLQPPMGMRMSAVGETAPPCFWDPLGMDDRRIEGREEVWQEYVAALLAGKIGGKYLAANKGEGRRLRSLQQIHDRRMGAVYTRTHITYRGKVVLPETFHTNYGMCVPGRERLFVGADGRFCPCERVPSQAESFVIGNVDAGFDIDAVMRLCDGNAALLEDLCTNCWNLTMCSIQCQSVVGKDGRLSRESKLEACEKVRRENHSRMVDMCAILEKKPDALKHLDTW